jgi:phosphoribosylglycinamide formyltransferase 1
VTALRVGVLFSERTDLAGAVHELAAADPVVALVAAATDRPPDERRVPPDVPVNDFPAARFADRVARDLAIAEWFGSRRVDLVVTAGWLWLLSPEFLDRFPNRVVNVHPTLLPAFPGRHSVEAAVAHGVHVHGVTVHLVDAGVDTGPILAQAASHFPQPTPAVAIRAALAPIERQLLCEVVLAFAHGQVHYDSRSARWTIAD